MPELDVIQLGFIPINTATKEPITTGRSCRQIYISAKKAASAMRQSEVTANLLAANQVAFVRVFMEIPK